MGHERRLVVEISSDAEPVVDFEFMEVFLIREKAYRSSRHFCARIENEPAVRESERTKVW